MESKFNWLLKKHEERILHDIDAVCYYILFLPRHKRSNYCLKHRSSRSVKTSSHSFLPQYSCQPIFSPSTSDSYCVSLNVSNYIPTISLLNLEEQFFTLKPNWFKNLSSTIISDDIISLLQFGEKFSLSFSAFQKNTFVHEYIENIEKNIHGIHPDVATDVRNYIIHILEGFLALSFEFSNLDKMIQNRTIKKISFGPPQFAFHKSGQR